MKETTWLGLSPKERTLLLDALSLAMGYAVAAKKRARELEALTDKLSRIGPHPSITVGVHGGQVQWVMGNPFPVRVCDYDGEKPDLPDRDERGQLCRIWFEPTDMEIRKS